MAIDEQVSEVSTAGRHYTMSADQASEAMLASMKLNGIERVWFTSGSEITCFQEGAIKHRALGKPTPRIMTMTHEQAALAAACGETVITGKPAATAFHVECGLMNAGGAIHNADRGRYPVLITSGYPPSAEVGSVPGARNSAIQWVQQIPDQGMLLRQYMRWDHKLATYDNAGLVVTRALQVMLSEPQGPAYLALPREATLHPVSGASFPLLDQLRPAPPPAPDANLLRQAADWLLEAQAPLLCVSRNGRNAAAVQPFVDLAETLGARVFHDTFRMNFPGNHPLSRGGIGRTAPPADTDCILVVDAVLPWGPGYAPDARTHVIRMDIDPVNRMTPIYEIPSDLSITADSAAALPALLEMIRTRITPEQARTIEARREQYQREGERRLSQAIETARNQAARGIISSAWLSHQIGQTLDADTILTHELCDSSLFNRTRPGTLISSGGSSIGWAAPAAIGVKVAAPDRSVVAAVGDGSWMFCNPQVTTWASAFHQAPVVFIIFNNRGYRTGTADVQSLFPEGYAAREKDYTGGWFDPCPNYAGEAAASGAYGEKVTDPEQVGPAIRRALNATQHGTLSVLDVWLPKVGLSQE